MLQLIGPDGWELLATLQEAVVVCDASDRIVYVNLEAERLLGWSAPNIAGSPADSLHPERLRTSDGSVLRRLARTATSGGRGERTFVLRSDGAEIEVEAATQLLSRGDGDWVVASLRQVAPREGSAIATELETYRLVFDHAPLGIAHFDERGVLTACNDYFCSILGATQRIAVGLSLKTLQNAPAVRAVERALAGQIGHFEGDYASMSSGQVAAVRGLFAPIRDAEGRVRGGVAMLEDISDRRRAEHAALRSETQFRTLIQSAPDGIAVHRDGKLLFVNPALSRMLGYDAPDQLLGCAMTELIHSDYHSEFRRRVAQMLATGRPLPAWEKRMRRRDGNEVTVEVLSLPLHFDGDSAILEHARDVAERKLIEARLAQADRLASVGTLAAGVAHEINNPLAYSLGSLEVAVRQVDQLRRELSGKEALSPVFSTLDECLANATEGNERVRVIVRDLMTFSRARAESRALLDVEIVLDSAVNLAWNEIRHRARLVKRYAGTAPVLADEARLGQVFLNLLLNAAQAIPEGRVSEHEIRLITEQRGERVIVRVEDNGVGIASDNFGRIFEPFFTTKPAAGTGLGLSICHGIVQALRGEIVVESLPRGTRFSVSLPAAGETEPVEIVTLQPPSSTPLRSRLLIVDDEPLLTQTLRAVLAEHEVVVVSAGQSALDLIAQDDRFDLVLCDLMMPELSGARVYEEIRDKKPELAKRFVFMTGGAFTDGARQFLEGFDGTCLEKPFAVERISALLEQMRQR